MLCYNFTKLVRIVVQAGCYLVDLAFVIACRTPTRTDETKPETQSKFQSPTDVYESYLAQTPLHIRELTMAIKGKNREEIMDILYDRYGDDSRNAVFGGFVPQWDVFGGKITFGDSVTFSDKMHFREIRLIQTTNFIKDNLLQKYEMTTPAHLRENGATYWLGNLIFGKDLSYKFIASDRFQNPQATQPKHFFKLHPTGTVVIQYADGIGPDTLLESLRGWQEVAHFVFTSADRTTQATYRIMSSEWERRLSFDSDEPLSFEMDCSWKNDLN